MQERLKQITKRVQSPNRLKIDTDWRARVDEECNKFKPNPNPEIEDIMELSSEYYLQRAYRRSSIQLL